MRGQDPEHGRLERCLEALSRMLGEGRFAADEPTIGVEVELALVDERMRPAMINHAVLERSDSELLTSELGSWNLEFNSPPRPLADGAARDLERDIDDAIARATDAARSVGARAVAVGILPTLGLEDLASDRLTDDPRYAQLNEGLRRARGRPFRLDVAAPPSDEGAGEHLVVDLESVAAEAACTSLQLHLQLSPEAFASYWNAAQAVAGVQVALAANSPFFLAHRLWAETRVPVFSQAVDVRSERQREHGVPPRVWFGDEWASSAYTLFEQDVRLFDTLLPPARSTDGEGRGDGEGADPLVELDGGRTPALAELNRHKSAIWRWNRPVYDVAGGVPHLRLENRVLPAGPTTVDAVANAMFFYGLVRALAEQDRPVWHRMGFATAEADFVAGARHGLAAQLHWPGHVGVGVADLVLEELLPLAEDGLAAWDVDTEVATHYLGVIEQRCRTRRSGAGWQVDTVADLERAGATRPEALRRMFSLYLENAESDRPVHSWR